MTSVTELTATEVANLTPPELQARGLSPAAVLWVVEHRAAGAVRFDPKTATITPLSVLGEKDR